MTRWSFPKRWSCERTLSSNSAMDCVASCHDRRASYLLILCGNRSPEIVERPAIVREVRQECEGEAKGSRPLHGTHPGLLGGIIDGRQCPAPKLRHPESHGEHC